MSIEQICILLAIGAIVSMLCRRMMLPYTVGLTIAGVALAFVPGTPGVALTKDLIFNAFLPPLIFEAAFQIRASQLKADAVVIALFATIGVALSVAVIASGAHFLAGWEWQAALVFAVLISATDPVSVVGTFKEIGTRQRLRFLVESESLFNDGTAAVLFGLVLASLAGTSVGVGPTVVAFCLTVGGGILCGAVISGIVFLLTWKTEDHLVEVAFTAIAAYSSFLLAERFHFSGVLATLTAGILIGNVGPLGVFSGKGRESVEFFWEFATFIANSLIFLLIGIRVAHRSFGAMWLTLAVIILVTVVGRAISVYLSSAVFVKSRWKIPMVEQHILVWGGLRGALGLALALALPESLQAREAIIDVTFGVVAFSVIVQGVTLRPLMKRLNVTSVEANLVA